MLFYSLEFDHTGSTVKTISSMGLNVESASEIKYGFVMCHSRTPASVDFIHSLGNFTKPSQITSEQKSVCNFHKIT